MARSQPAQKETLDFLPVLIGAALIGVFYLPGFRGLLGLLLFVGLALVVAMLTLATGAAIWRHKKGQAAELARSAADFFSPPAPFIERDETPPASETILESESSDETSLESPPESEQVEADRFEEDAPLAPERPPPPLWLTWRLELLQAVEWRRFADVVTAYHCELGREARITRIGRRPMDCRGEPARLTLRKAHSRINKARQSTANALPTAFTAPSFNGRTADSGSADRGSNPWGAAKFFPA